MRTLGLARALALVGALALTAGCTDDAPSADEHARNARKHYAPALVPLNDGVAASARVDAIRPGGSSGYDLTGAGVLVAEWDEGGARETHRDLAGRVALGDGAGLSDHATHVAATISGGGLGDPAALGMAPSARLLSYSLELDLIELENAAPFVSASNHAYGPSFGWEQNPACPDVWSWTAARSEEDARFGHYDGVAAALDRIVRDEDVLSVWAAGNDRDDGPVASGEAHAHGPDCRPDFTDTHRTERELEYGTLGGAAIAKNVLTVGAIRDLPRSFDASDVTLLPASSFGPTDDGRIKPDVVAGGESVRSAVASADDAYDTESGTSAAAAAVTGIAALLVEHFRATHAERDPRAAELKAILVHSALDVGAPGPDAAAGHGLVDARTAADFVDADRATPRLRVDVTTGAENELSTAEIAEGTAIRVTLAWLDPPGVVRAAGDPNPVLENDLDLSLVAPDGSVFHPWSLDRESPESVALREGPNRVDTVEVVDVDAEDNRWTGVWTVRVEPARALARGEAQPYALAASVPLSAPERPIVGSRTRLELELSTTGTATVSLPIENLGGGTLDWTATTESPLVELERASGTTGDELVVHVSARELAPGETAFAEIELQSSEPGAPRTVGLVLRAPCEADCSGRTCGVDPVCGVPCGRCGAGLTCDAAGACTPLSAGCPAAELGSVLGSSVVSGVTSGSSALSSSCGGELGADAAFAWTAPQTGRYVFSTEGSTFDTILAVLRDDCRGTEIACSDDTLDLTSSLVVDLEAGDAVTAVVDGYGDASGPFSLDIHELTCPDGVLDERLGIDVLPDAAPGRLDRMRASCAPAAAREAALAFRAPADGTYRFDASRSNFEATVAVLRDDCSGEELACGDDNVELALFAGAEVVVVVDGAMAHEDRFTLGVTLRGASCGGDCNARPDGGLCACDARCVELGDCCFDACGECASCAPDQDCEFGRCIPRRCTGGNCNCSGTGGTNATGCDAGAGGEPGEGGAPSDGEPSSSIEPSGCSCRTASPRGDGGLVWLGIALGICALASRRTRI